MFDFRLKVFHTVAQRLNFTKAAEELSITQPAVTKHIHEIETYFRIKLFQRNGSKIKLTAAGETLLQHTERLFEIYRNIEFDLGSLTQRQSGTLRVGASTTIAQYVLPPHLAAFSKKFQDIKVQLISNNTEQIENALINHKIDFGIIEGYSKRAQLKYTEFIKDEIVLIARTNHPLTKKGSISLAELQKLPLILREHGSGSLEVILLTLKKAGIKPSDLTIEMRLESTESIKSYLMNSDCLAFVSIHSIIRELKNKELSIIDIKNFSIDRYFYFVKQQGEALALPDLFSRFLLNNLK
jgi:DNA-binding transcriptional LysR family regulator